MATGRKVFLAVVLSQLISVALVLGWYFYILRAEIVSQTQQRAQEVVLQSIVKTEDYFKPAEVVAEAGALLLSDKILGPDRPDLLERYFHGQLRLRPRLAGLYVGNSTGEFFYVMRSNEQGEGGTRTKVIRNGPRGREVELTWRRPDYSVVKTEQDPADTYDPRERSWYRSAVERRGRAWTEPYVFFTSRKPGITVAAPVMSKDGAIDGVIGVDLEMNDISRYLAEASLMIGKSVYISTPEGKVIAHSSADVVTPDKTGGDNALRFRTISELPGVEGKLGERVRKELSEPIGASTANVWDANAEGQNYFVAIGKMSDLNWPWQIVVTVPSASVLEPTSRSLLIFIVGLATLFAGAIGYLASRAVGVPLAQLLANAQLARNGNIELMKSSNAGSSEFRELNRIIREFAVLRRKGASGDGVLPERSSGSG
jgi:hypothetical protein